MDIPDYQDYQQQRDSSFLDGIIFCEQAAIYKTQINCTQSFSIIICADIFISIIFYIYGIIWVKNE